MSSSHKSRLITSGSGAAYEAWKPPIVLSPVLQQHEDERLRKESAHNSQLTAATLEQLQEKAYVEGFEKGHTSGIAAAKDDITKTVALLSTLMTSLTSPFEKLDDKVVAELGQLAALIARQIVRRELKTETGQIVSIVREAVSNLPIASHNIRVVLHPEDASLVRTALSMREQEQRWELVEDPVISRGGCKVVSESARIDATVEAQLNAVIANALGGERQSDTLDDA
jgi:flagellar assembly protein FliH